MAEPLEAQVPRSTPLSVYHSQEQLEAILANLSDADSSSIGGSMTEAGKRRQMTKMLALIMAPIVALIGVSLYFMADNISSKMESDVVRDSVQYSTELGQLIHLIQKERDMSVLYLSSIGPETKTFLSARYLETDEFLEDLTDWPVDIDRQKRDYFKSKRLFRRHLSTHRNEIRPTDGIFDEVNFYSDLVLVLIRWIYDAIRESRFGTVWKSLVAYQKVVSAKEQLGIERALGSSYLSTGGFSDIEAYYLYNEKRSLYKSNIRSALLYAPFLTDQSQESDSVLGGLRLMSLLLYADTNETSPLAPYRRLIMARDRTIPSLRNATHFYDNMTQLIAEHLKVQRAIAEKILELLIARNFNMTSGVALSCCIIVLVLVMCPLLIKTVQRLTDNIQNYALTLAAKTKELNKEKKRTDSLLYQMLPKPVADKLKKKSNVDAEFFREVTIFFSDILGFSRLVRECGPMDIVNVLNHIYTVFDKRIGLYDVYKVETIGDSYMIASGLPQRNGRRHCTEIANFALDLLQTCGNMTIKEMPEGRLRLRIGIHTGQCVAGVVGLRLPRYCLFGDTVNTASRMETTGLPNCIHISSSTNRMLRRTGNYIIQRRGSIEVKGKGVMTTYFLLGRNVSPRGSVKNSDTSLSSTMRYPDDRKFDSTKGHPFHGLAKDAGSGDEDGHIQVPQASGSLAGREEIVEPLEPQEQEGTVAAVTKEETVKGQKEGEEDEHDEEIESEIPPTKAKLQNPSIEKSDSSAPPPSYQDLEEELARSSGSPPILKVVEGYHF